MRKTLIVGTVFTIIVVSCTSDREPPEAVFSAKPRVIDAGQEVHFINKSKNYKNILWDFGDGTTSIEVNPKHVYYEPGNYFPKLMVSRKNEISNSFLKVTVLVPDYSVNVEPLSQTSLDSFSMSCITEVPVSWRIGDDIVSRHPDFTHKFKRDGTYDLKLQIKGTEYTLWDTTLIISLKVNAAVSPVQASINDQIFYTCDSTKQVRWDINGEKTSIENNGSISFKTPGEKKITLYDELTGEMLQEFFINIEDKMVEPKVTASVSPQNVEIGESIYFSTNNRNDVKWDISGEQSSTQKKGSYIFLSEGKKIVKLYDANTNDLIRQFTVMVKDKPPIPPPPPISEINDMLNQLADYDIERFEKDKIVEKFYKYCDKAGKTRISGVEDGMLSDFIRKLRIEANPYEIITTSVTPVYNKKNKIIEIKVNSLDKEEI